MKYEKRIAQELNIQPRQVRSAIDLLDDGNTIPFIARYRKEMTFSLDELQLREIQEKVTYFRAVDDRRQSIIDSIRSQDKLNDELMIRLQDADTLVELEDLYQPYKIKRKTRASKAIDAGLEPLAMLIVNQPRNRNIIQEAKKYLCDAFISIEEVLAGARDIVAQIVADDPEIRGQVRQKAIEWGTIQSTKIKNADDSRQVFKSYYDFNVRVKWIKPYQTLAIDRGEAEKVLRVRVEVDERDWLQIINNKFRSYGNTDWSEQLNLAIEDGAKRLLLPAVERDVRRSLTETAHDHAIDVFAQNLRRLLLQPPLMGHIVLGIDPGFRTGCKLAVINTTGTVLYTGTIYPNPPQSQYNESLNALYDLVDGYNISLIVIGNGTASRETEQLVAELIHQRHDVKYLIVNEAGASVYSASDVAREELPELDVSLRGAVSIARRAQDPLAELVKIDPQSIGVGLYQHDLNQNQLSESLNWVVQSVVNQVGVDLNTASSALLKYVSGITERVAQELVSYRDNKGKFHSRNQLLEVKGLGEKTFEQASGFLRIRDGVNWLDNTAIHPESYPTTEKLLQIAKIKNNQGVVDIDKLEDFLNTITIDRLAEQLNVGMPTIQDILEQLLRPGRDPRDEIPKPILRSDVLKTEDLFEGMLLQGTVRNVVDFGAFIDIGVKQDGLLHVSKMPRDLDLQVGDVIEVKIISIDADRGRIGFAVE